MQVSEARLAANRLNALRSTGPRTAEGKTTSRRNALKHGLAGEGVVIPEGDAEEIQGRIESLTAEMTPQTSAGSILISQMATLSVRMERAAEQETAATAMRVRHAAESFDDERIEAAEQLFATLADDPRTALRKLKRTPEGVERLIDAWTDLRADLAIDPEPDWTAEHLERAANLTGLKAKHARGSRLGALSRASWGDFAALDDGEGLDDDFRKGWAREQLFERIDAEIAALEDHDETLDFETLAIDRAEAGARALFDASKPSCLARRYESEARRGFFRSLREFRQIEAQAAATIESSPTPPQPSRSSPPLGSFRQDAGSDGKQTGRLEVATPIASDPPIPGSDGRPLAFERADKKPG